MILSAQCEVLGVDLVSSKQIVLDLCLEDSTSASGCASSAQLGQDDAVERSLSEDHMSEIGKDRGSCMGI